MSTFLALAPEVDKMTPRTNPYPTLVGLIGIILGAPILAQSNKTEISLTFKIIITMAKKKKSGKRFTIRAPGRRRFRPGPKPRKGQIEIEMLITKDKGRLKDYQIEIDKKLEEAEQFADDNQFKILTEYSACHCYCDPDLARNAFDGWKALHFGLKNFKQLPAQ